MFKHIRGLQNAQDVLTSDQKREYLRILLMEGKAAAQIFLNESIPKGAWFGALPLQMRISILKFAQENGQGNTITNEDFNIIKDCLDCCSDGDYDQCLERGRKEGAKESDKKRKKTPAK